MLLNERAPQSSQLKILHQLETFTNLFDMISIVTEVQKSLWGVNVNICCLIGCFHLFVEERALSVLTPFSTGLLINQHYNSPSNVTFGMARLQTFFPVSIAGSEIVVSVCAATDVLSKLVPTLEF